MNTFWFLILEFLIDYLCLGYWKRILFFIFYYNYFKSDSGRFITKRYNVLYTRVVRFVDTGTKTGYPVTGRY